MSSVGVVGSPAAGAATSSTVSQAASSNANNNASGLLRAASWLLGSSVASQALRLISSLVLTRLLAPEAFGLVVTLQTVYLGLVLVSDLGVWQSVVNAPVEDDPQLLGTAFSLQVLRGGLLAGVIAAAATGLALAQTAWPAALSGAYANPELPAMLGLFCVMALAQGLESMKLALTQRRLETAVLARLELSAQLVGLVLTLVLAWFSQSVWSLVVGSVVSALTRTVLSHVWLKGPPFTVCWDAAQARHLLKFGKWILLSSLIGFLAAHGEKLLLSGLLDAALLGRYAIAAALMGAVVAVVNALNGHFVFPALSRALRAGPEEGLWVYSGVQRTADWTLGLLGGVLMTCGQHIVYLLYDGRYGDAGWMMQWLAMGLVGTRFQVLEQMMFAMSCPARVTLSNALRGLALVLGVPAAYVMAGLDGALAAVALAQFAGWPVALHFRRRLGVNWVRVEWVWPLAVAIGLGVGACINLALI